MKTSSLSLKIYLLLAGLIGVVVGSAIMLFPVSFYALSGIELGGNISLLNEMRAPGGSLLVAGVVILLGVAKEKLTYGAIVVSTLAYLSYGASRLVSLAMDGLPATDLVVVAVAEWVIGALGIIFWAKYSRTQATAAYP